MKRKNTHLEDRVWDDAKLQYRRRSWGDPLPLDLLFDRCVVENCTPDGYVQPEQWPRPPALLPGGVTWQPDPLLEVLTWFFCRENAVVIFNLAFGESGGYHSALGVRLPNRWGGHHPYIGDDK